MSSISAAPAASRLQVESEARANLLVLCLLAVLIGVATGIGAVALRGLIGLIHNLCYFGRLSVFYDANVLEGPSRFGDWIALSPVLGGLLVVFLVLKFAPEAKGHGVPEVMDAIFYKRGVIRWQVALIKSVASALSIGTGAAVGREGPIIQIGAALGSAFSQRLNLTTSQRITLLSAGAGAGIAATFNTPLGGVLFALEILLPEVSNRTFLPVVLATGAATLLGRVLIGPDPAFIVPAFVMPHARDFNPEQALAYVALGAIVGLGAWAFIRVLVWMEDTFPKIPGGPYVQNVIGMGIVGVMMAALARLYGHHYVDGVGYGVIQTILDGGMAAPALLGLLFALKLLATSVSLGSGASGGIFSPSLYLGATLGAGFALLVGRFLPGAGLQAPSAAIVGMAAMVGAGTGGVMTAIVMVFEMTRDYEIIVPVIVAVAVAAGVRRFLVAETIYTVKLRHRGHRIPKERHANLYLVAPARDVMEPRFVRAEAGAPLSAALASDDADDLMAIVVEREGRIVGLVPPRSGLWVQRREDPSLTIDAFVEPQLVLIREDDLLSRALARLKRHRAGAAIVYAGAGRPLAKNVVGVVTKRAIADAVIDNFDD
jgi:CIC family chloride channel protein